LSSFRKAIADEQTSWQWPNNVTCITLAQAQNWGKYQSFRFHFIFVKIGSAIRGLVSGNNSSHPPKPMPLRGRSLVNQSMHICCLSGNNQQQPIGQWPAAESSLILSTSKPTDLKAFIFLAGFLFLPAKRQMVSGQLFEGRLLHSLSCNCGWL
jgi:hypothetical protein